MKCIPLTGWSRYRRTRKSIDMHAEDYAMQTAVFYFACAWLILRAVLCLIGGIICIIDKIRNIK